jgi:hypothetical protein
MKKMQTKADTKVVTNETAVAAITGQNHHNEVSAPLYKGIGFDFCLGPEKFLDYAPTAGEGVNGFTPSRYELIEIVKYWHKQRIEIEWYQFVYWGGGLLGPSLVTFAGIRIEQIRQVIGDDDVNKALSDVEVEFSKKVDPRAWQIFLRGDRDEQEAFHLEPPPNLVPVRHPDNKPKWLEWLNQYERTAEAGDLSEGSGHGQREEKDPTTRTANAGF